MSKTRKRILPIIEKKIESIGNSLINRIQSRNNVRKFMGMIGSQNSKNIKRVKFPSTIGVSKHHKKYKYTPKRIYK